MLNKIFQDTLFHSLRVIQQPNSMIQLENKLKMEVGQTRAKRKLIDFQCNIFLRTRQHQQIQRLMQFLIVMLELLLSGLCVRTCILFVSNLLSVSI